MDTLLKHTLVDRAHSDDNACVTRLNNDKAVERDDNRRQHNHSGNYDFLDIYINFFLLSGLHCFSPS